MQVRDSSGTKTKEKVSLIFPLLNSVTEEKADFLRGNGHDIHSRNRGRKKVTEKLVRKTIPGRKKSATGGEEHGCTLPAALLSNTEQEKQSWNEK